MIFKYNILNIYYEFKGMPKINKSRAHPPLGKVSRVDNTDSVPTPSPSHIPDLPDGVSIDVILQDSAMIFGSIAT